MKIFSLAFVLIFLFSISSFGQAEKIINSAQKSKIESYLKLETKPLDGKQFKVLYHFNFGKSEIINVNDLPILTYGTVKKINLYYSDFPKNGSFKKLNKERIQNLITAGNISNPESIEWHLIKQKECNSIGDAMKLFHGFEVILEYAAEMSLTAIEIDTNFKDYVVQKVLERNKWKEMLIVTDLTGSMYPYTSQLFIWLKLNTIDDRIKQFVFFNDGDTDLDKNKKIGDTGGIYHTRSMDYEEVERIATQCMVSGTGGDIPENDIEALLTGIKLCPDCKENILIADNLSEVRDFNLMKKLDRPIRVIICGGSEYINAEYLNLARETKGSIHLIEEDIFNLMEMNEGELIDINGTEFIIEKNKFTEYKKDVIAEIFLESHHLECERLFIPNYNSMSHTTHLAIPDKFQL